MGPVNNGAWDHIETDVKDSSPVSQENMPVHRVPLQSVKWTYIQKLRYFKLYYQLV